MDLEIMCFGHLPGPRCILLALLCSQLITWAAPLTTAVPDACTALGVAGVTNGQIQLPLTGESGVPYVLESSADLRDWTPVLTNSAPSIGRVFSVSVPDHAAFYRSCRAPLPLFAYALAARSSITANGTGRLTDSFNSADPELSTAGLYDPTKTSSQGHLASLFGPVNLGNHAVNGDVYLGPGVRNLPGWPQIAGTIHWDFNACFADVKLPDVTGWSPAPAGHTLIDGRLYDYAFFGPTNDYTLSTVASAIYVAPKANVRLVVTTTDCNFSLVRIAGLTNQAGNLTVYQLAGQAVLLNAVLDGGNAASLKYFGSAGVTNVTFPSATTAFTGAVYAPSASFTFNGGGTNDFVGSCIGKTVTVNGHYAFHFDENLLRVGPTR